MGADIHMYLERVPLVKRRDEILSSLLNVKEADIKTNWDLVKEDIFNGRNYNLFGRLADVRTREGIIPLSEPRGIPNDASIEYIEQCNYWDYDAHSHSYFYLSELIKEDWINISQEMHELVEKLKSEYTDTDSVRIVFFFDN